MKENKTTSNHLPKLALVFFALFFMSIHASAQYMKECGTPSSSHDKLKDIPLTKYRILSGTRVIKMYIVIYSDNDGSNQAMSEEDVLTEIKVADSVYSIGNICFTIVGIEFRNSSTYNNPIYPQN